MPTYQYACTECGEQLEVQQRFTDDALSTCPMCTGRLRKVFNAVGVVFKGSGFYRTDSRVAKADGKADGKGEGKVDAKPDSKAAAGTTASNGAAKDGATSSGGTTDKGSTAGAGKAKASDTA